MRVMQSTVCSLREVAVVGPQYPGRDRIISSTMALRDALVAEFPGLVCSFVIVGDDQPHDCPGPLAAHYSIRHQNAAACRSAARFLNASHAEAVCLHYGSGIYSIACLISFLDELRKPLVTVFHKVEPDPGAEEHRILELLFQKSARIVTMTQAAREVLRASHHVAPRKIVVIPHGIPDLPLPHPPQCKEAVGLRGSRVLLTCGHLEPRKGIEHVIKALPAVIHQHPELVYVIVGATEPHVLETHGEEYRHHLKDLVEAAGLQNHVLFVNRFVSEDELHLYLGAADICVTPYDIESRSCSANLSRMVGNGKAVISTPYPHARELLADGRGRLVRFASPMALSSAILELLGDGIHASSLRQRAWEHGRQMIWPKVARDFMETFHAAINHTPTQAVPAWNPNSLSAA
jgi:glycosyltransferase involved in cell wall biosynthesis